MAGWTLAKLEKYLRYHNAAVELLKELDQSKFPFKKVSHFRFCCCSGTAVWEGKNDRSGHLTIFGGCQPGAVAHELGHGFHERLRSNHPKTKNWGEAYAEAIRWFTEDKMGNDRWCDEYKKSGRDRQVLEKCGYDWDKFKQAMPIVP